jgi:hypothetical protein
LPPRVVPDQGYTGLCAACLRAAVISHGSRRRAASGSSSRHRRTSDESLMRRLARHALRRLCTGSAARSAWWVWSIRLARAPPSRPGPEEARARRTRLSHMDLPAHRRTPRGPQESKEVVAHTMLPYELKVTAACQTHRTPEARCDLAPLYRWLAGWPPLGNAATSEISGGETLGYTAPPMMVHGEHRNMGEVEQERAHARWRACSGHQ